MKERESWAGQMEGKRDPKEGLMKWKLMQEEVATRFLEFTVGNNTTTISGYE